jgi:hypothetical protein
VRTIFVLCANIHRTQFWFLHYYLLHKIFVSRPDILRAFYSTCCTMTKFSTLPSHTNTLRAPLTKLLYDNIFLYCTCTNQTPLRYTNTAHTTRAIIMCVHTVHTLLYICTPCNAKFNTCTHTPTLICVAPKFNARTYTPIFFHAAPKFSARTRTQKIFRAVPKFSTCTNTLIFFHVAPNFSARACMPIFFCVMPKFSAPSCVDSFLCASNPREFPCRNWSFCLNFPQFLP